MIAPLGYKEGTRDGTLVGDAEKKSFSQRIYNMLAPNEKESDEQLRLQGINPSSVLPEERPIAKNNPEGILQGLAREILGIGKKAEGSDLSSMAAMEILKLDEEIKLLRIDQMLNPDNDNSKAIQGKMMYEMLIEKNPDAGAETILDLIMKRPEFLSGEETVGDMLEERTQSKANGGIVSLFGNM